MNSSGRFFSPEAAQPYLSQNHEIFPDIGALVLATFSAPESNIIHLFASVNRVNPQGAPSCPAKGG